MLDGTIPGHDLIEELMQRRGNFYCVYSTVEALAPWTLKRFEVVLMQSSKDRAKLQRVIWKYLDIANKHLERMTTREVQKRLRESMLELRCSEGEL